MSSTDKAIYYRRTRFSEPQTRTLQQMVSEALTNHPLVRDRLEAIDAGASEFRVISAKKTVGTFLCGRLTTFQRGGYQVVIKDDPDATDLPLSAIEPPDTDGVPHQFATGMLYFCIMNDHVAVIQSPSLKARGLEQHLAWLLRGKTGILATHHGLALSDEPQEVTRDRIRKSHVKSILLGRPLMDDSVLVASQDGKGKGQTKFKPTGPMLEFLKGMIDPTQFERLDIEDRVFDGNLEVWIELRYPKRIRNRPEDSVKLLDDLALALRDFDEDQSRLELADGTTVVGSQLKISSRISVSTKDGLIAEGELYDGMCGWIESLIKNSVITD